MKNEPVAWTDGKGNYFDKNSFFPVDDLIPLYTHPVSQYKAITNTKIEPTVVSYTYPVKEQGNPVAWRSQDPDGYWSVYQSPVEGAEPLYTGIKELTDEEITACMGFLPKYNSEIVDEDLVNFARAILRKAQENGNV